MKSGKYIIVFISVALLAAGCLGQPRTGKEGKVYNNAEQQLANTQTIQYEGEEGKTALQLLKERYQVQTKMFAGAGEYVESISGVQPDSKHFWAFYVNGQSSMVGASEYQTKSSDRIEWRMEEIE